MYVLWTDGLPDQQGVHTAICSSPSTDQQSPGDHPVLPTQDSGSPVQAAGTPEERRHFQGSQQRGECGLLLPVGTLQVGTEG